jgi:hypothetical protein
MQFQYDNSIQKTAAQRMAAYLLWEAHAAKATRHGGCQPLEWPPIAILLLQL